LPFIGGGFDAFDGAAAAPAADFAVPPRTRAAFDAVEPVPDATRHDVAAFDPLAFDAADAAAGVEPHFADLAAALGNSAPPVPLDSELARRDEPAPWAALDAAALAQPEPELEPELDPEPMRSLATDPSGLAGAPAATSRWVDELRRSPVWIPTGDMLTGPDPTRPDRGLSMELESVIDSFREQMTRALDGDGQARYDLGVAYYDMGLYNEALAEFEAAAGCAGLEVQSYEMLAQCLLQTGRNTEAVELLLPIVAADGHAFRGALGLHYCLGLAYEGIGDFEQARRCYEEVALVDVDFKDVQSRLQRT
jgi:tetratricopeptide (TPR) repeat protein